MKIVEADQKARQAIVKQEEVEKILCEGIFKSSPDEDPPAITKATLMKTGFREPLDTSGNFREK